MLGVHAYTPDSTPRACVIRMRCCQCVSPFHGLRPSRIIEQLRLLPPQGPPPPLHLFFGWLSSISSAPPWPSTSLSLFGIAPLACEPLHSPLRRGSPARHSCRASMKPAVFAVNCCQALAINSAGRPAFVSGERGRSPAGFFEVGNVIFHECSSRYTIYSRRVYFPPLVPPPSFPPTTPCKCFLAPGNTMKGGATRKSDGE